MTSPRAALVLVGKPEPAGTPETEVRVLLQRTVNLLGQVQEQVLRQGAAGLPGCDQLLADAQSNLSNIIFILKRNPSLPVETVEHLASNLQLEVEQVMRMFQQAVQFYSQWIHVINAKSAGYTEGGLPAGALVSSRFSVDS